MEHPRRPLRSRIKAATLLESVLALALLAGALSFGVYMHFRVMSSARSGDRCEAWSMSERVADGRSFRILTVVDQFTRECLCLLADRSLTGEKVAQALELLVGQRGVPRSITVDNGSEFASRVMDAWAYRRGCNGLSSSGPRMCAWRGR